MKIYNLDKFIPEDKEIRFKGFTWVIPGDIDLETYAKIAQIDEKKDDKDMLDSMHLILNMRQVVDKEILRKNISWSLFRLITYIIFNDDDEEELEKIHKEFKEDKKKLQNEEIEKVKSSQST